MQWNSSRLNRGEQFHIQLESDESLTSSSGIRHASRLNTQFITSKQFISPRKKCLTLVIN
jgi:hypothetical protein